MKNYLTFSIFLTAFVVFTSFVSRDANAACWINSYGNVQCDNGTVLERQNTGQYWQRDGRGNVQRSCGIDYLGRWSCN